MPKPVCCIAEVRIGGAKAARVRSDHNVEPYEVREAVVLCPVERSRWVWDKERGYRLFVTGSTAANRALNVVLFAIDEDEGILATRNRHASDGRKCQTRRANMTRGSSEA